jgi:hypothetical protein
MAGLENVVRPHVFPSIRPTSTRTAAPVDKAGQGGTTITGSGGRIINLPYSYSISMNQSRPTESKRRVDVARVYQMDDDGTVNKDTFVDINVANKIWMQGSMVPYFYTRIQQSDNIEIRETDKIIENPAVQ